MIAIIPAPTYVLDRAAWIPTLVIWHADGRLTRLEGARAWTTRQRWPRAGGCARIEPVPPRWSRAHAVRQISVSSERPFVYALREPSLAPTTFKC